MSAAAENGRTAPLTGWKTWKACKSRHYPVPTVDSLVPGEKGRTIVEIFPDWSMSPSHQTLRITRKLSSGADLQAWSILNVPSRVHGLVLVL